MLPGSCEPSSVPPSVLLSSALLFACSESDQVNHPATAALQALTVSLDLAAPAVGEHVVASVKGTYADGSEKAVTAGLTWRSSNAALLEGDRQSAGPVPGEGDGLRANPGVLR